MQQMFQKCCETTLTFASEKLLKTFNAMNKNQRMNRMGALLIIWAAACLNSHAQQDSVKVVSNSKEEGNRNVMLNAASANGPQLSATFMVELCQSKLIDLCAVLILCKAKFERTRVKILIDTSTVEPVLADASVQVEIKLLFAKVIGIIIQHAIEILSLVQSQFGKRVHSITDVSGSNGSFGYFKQSGMSQATVSTPVRVYIMGICFI